MRRVAIHITGKVQGVAFRICAKREAEHLGITGRAWNAPDGSVRIEADGPTEAIDRLIAWCRSGPPRAEVHGVSVSEKKPEEHFADFKIVG